MARLVGINHIAIEVGDVDEAVAFFERFFDDVKLRGRSRAMAFVDMGDQFLALAERGDREPDRERHFGLVVDDRDAVLTAAREAGTEIFGGNSFRDPWGNHVQVVAYGEVQFSKTPEILRGMGLELGKTEAAQRELRDKGLS